MEGGWMEGRNLTRRMQEIYNEDFQKTLKLFWEIKKKTA